MEIKITIPTIFVSVNSQYRTARVGRQQIPLVFLTKEAKAYKELVKWTARQQYRGEPLDCPIKIKVIYYFPNHKRRDILNDKLTFDALEGIIFDDDKQISEAHIYRKYDKKNPLTEIVIYSS